MVYSSSLDVDYAVLKVSQGVRWTRAMWLLPRNAARSLVGCLVPELPAADKDPALRPTSAKPGVSLDRKGEHHTVKANSDYMSKIGISS
jgi:hypothetical protein